MIRGLMVSADAMTPIQHAQEILSNNLANAVTGGFRQDRLAFHQAEESARGASLPAGSAVESGSAAAPELVEQLDFRVGPLQATQDRLNLAISGPGFFVVQGPQGELYTRDGSLRLGADGTLLHRSGYPILTEGGPITLPPSAEFTVAADGTAMVNGAAAGKLRLVALPDTKGVQHAGEGLVRSDTPAETDAGSRVVQGFLEGANVDPVSTMVDMMALLHNYEANQKAILTQDGSLGRLIQWAAG
jgi:flagellar basal-body rod protein FlgF